MNELARANGYTFYLEPGPVPRPVHRLLGPRAAARSAPARAERQHGRQLHRRPADVRLRRDGQRRAAGARAGPAAPATCALLAQPDISPLRPPLGRRASPALKRKTLSGTAKKELGQAEAETLARAATSADAISGSGSLDVNRHGYVLRPRELVGVRGSGVTYDGDYYVKSVTHNLGPARTSRTSRSPARASIARSGTVRP